MSSARVRVAAVSDLVPGRIRMVEIESIPICLITVNGVIYAVAGRCPHNGSSLAGGIVSGVTLLCPQHYWTFSLADGKLLRPPLDACLSTYPVVVEGDEVFIEIGSGTNTVPPC